MSLALSGAVALFLNDLAHARISEGVVGLMAVLVLRWLSTSSLDDWAERAAAGVRHRWRVDIVTLLDIPRREGERARGDLTLAIEQSAQAPELERLRSSAATSLLGIVVVFWAAGWLGLLITLGLVALAAPLYRRAGARSDAMAQQYQARRATLEARQLEILQHAPELRALGAVTYGADEIAAISDSEHSLALRAIRVALGSSLVTEFLSGVSVGLVAMVVGFGLLDGRLSLVRALVAVLITADLFTQVRRYGVEFHRREDTQRALDALRIPTRPPAPTPQELLVAEGLVTDTRPDAVSLVIRPGDRVTVTGPSGAGKTSLLLTLVGWRAARAGSSRLGDAPVGFVSHESAVLSGTLRENLSLGDALGDDELRGALEALALRGPRFEDLDTQLLVDGRGLSSGERVRVVLARALLHHVALLVLDDVSGVLDDEARRAVRTTLEAASGLAIIEASVDAPLLRGASRRIELNA
ncbi:MAG TPA: ATP-binding cassette domain-containing protein [Acidimicrobiales bacterium]|nr:ATP-binding cassette domain-containing protein [Acidimicrobiales bacterium]